MKRRVQALLRIWEDEGVTIWAEDGSIRVTGLDPLPPWWGEWVATNYDDLIDLLAPKIKAERVKPRPPLPENCPMSFNVLSFASAINRPKQIDHQTPERRRLVERIKQLERLREYWEAC